MIRSNPARRRLPLQLVLLVSAIAFLTLALGCSTASSVDDAGPNAPRSVEEIKTTGEAAAFLHHALKTTEWVTSQRDFLNLPAAQLAHQQAKDTLELAIKWLHGTSTIEPTKNLPPQWQQVEQTLLGVWRHRLNEDGTENVVIFAPKKSFVATRGSQVWVGNWERRGDLLYTQNDRGSSDQYMYLSLPDIQRITTNKDGSIKLSSVSQADQPGFTLTRIH